MINSKTGAQVAQVDKIKSFMCTEKINNPEEVRKGKKKWITRETVVAAELINSETGVSAAHQVGERQVTYVEKKSLTTRVTKTREYISKSWLLCFRSFFFHK